MPESTSDLNRQIEMQLSLMKAMKTTQDDVAEKIYAFMRVTVDIQEVMLRRLNVLAYLTTTITVLALIGVFALLTQ